MRLIDRDFYLNKFVKNDYDKNNNEQNNKIIYEEINTDVPNPSNFQPENENV